MPLSPTGLRGLAALASAAALVLSGCGDDEGWPARDAAPSAVGTLAAGFVDPSAPPTPESTVTPSPGSWDDVRPSDGYRVVLVTSDDDAPTRTLVEAVEGWAEAEDVALRTIEADGSDRLVPSLTDAMDLAPDLIVTAGNDLVDPMALVTANHLDRQFLVLGAEVAEPTHNVTATDWAGASFRGEGLGMSSTYDASSFTPERADRAIRAGVAAVLTGTTGIVIWLE